MKLSWYLLICVVFCLNTDVIAQNDHSEAGDCCKWFHLNGYGSLNLRSQKTGSSNSTLLGFSGNYLITDWFSLGAGGFSSLNSYGSFNEKSIEDQELRMGYGGIYPEFRYHFNKRIWIFSGFLIGVGGYEKSQFSGAYTVIDPSVSLCFQIVKNFLIGLNSNYTYIMEFEGKNFSSGYFSGFSSGVQLKFGMFKGQSKK